MAEQQALDLAAYLARIGYTGPREPTLATLCTLQLEHVMAVPFENLDVLLGRRISIDPADVQKKIIREKRGGYCFEQNSLFRDVLRALGYAVTPLLARIRWQVPADYRTPLTHMVLRVEAAGRSWLVDVGLGGVGATAPLALDTEAEQPTPHEPRRVIKQSGGLMHQMRAGEKWMDVFEFTLTEPAPMDFELGNWYSCTHPKAIFMNNLVVARTEKDRRVIVHNCDFTFRFPDGRAETRNIASPDELLALLAEHFGLHFPAGTRFGAPGAAWPV